jgi:hypothetical protein
VADQPLREQFRAQLMLALDMRQGRHDRALRLF